jgi:hypothetical protein
MASFEPRLQSESACNNGRLRLFQHTSGRAALTVARKTHVFKENPAPQTPLAAGLGNRNPAHVSEQEKISQAARSARVALSRLSSDCLRHRATKKGYVMDQRVPPTDLELAALISSRICHDIINPVGAIFNGLEILDEDDDIQAKSYALNVIRNVTEQASARLEFARFALVPPVRLVP